MMSVVVTGRLMKSADRFMVPPLPFAAPGPDLMLTFVPATRRS